jgi:hypothetical protein
MSSRNLLDYFTYAMNLDFKGLNKFRHPNLTFIRTDSSNSYLHDIKETFISVLSTTVYQ